MFRDMRSCVYRFKLYYRSSVLYLIYIGAAIIDGHLKKSKVFPKIIEMF